MFTAGAPCVGLQRRWGALRRTLCGSVRHLEIRPPPPKKKGQDNTKQRDVSILVTAGEEGGLLRQRDQKGTFSDYIKF